MEQKKLLKKNENDNFIQNFDLKQYRKIKKIGEGESGEIFLIENKNNENERYALKQIQKINQPEKCQVYKEYQIAQKLKHPFLVKFITFIEDKTDYYFLFEFCPGGDLHHLIQQNIKLTNSQAKFYAAQILIVLEYLRKEKIIYRDIKPENILIDENGYIKLADFGVSTQLKMGTEQTGSIIESLENYRPPESIKGQNYGYGYDYYQFGCLLYEMLKGDPPFQDDSNFGSNIEEQKIRGKIEFPSNISKEAQSLITQLLTKDEKKRLQDPEKIKKSKFFKGFKFDQLLNKKLTSPFKPALRNQNDYIQYFDSEYINQDIDQSKIQYSNISNIYMDGRASRKFNNELSEIPQYQQNSYYGQNFQINNYTHLTNNQTSIRQSRTISFRQSIIPENSQNNENRICCKCILF